MVEEKGSEDFWLKIVNEGVEGRVEVNQRMLIDKMLARYSSEFVIYRELIQNSDDAQSTSFTLEITCDTNSSTFNYQSIHQTNSSRSANQILKGIGNIFKTSLGFSSQTNQTQNQSEENQFNNCLISEIRTINNGNIFNDEDWKRVITIAEGNTNVDAIGQFGVGFFSVFSYSEKPMIQSGKYCLAFAWKNGKSLTTFKKQLNEQQQTTTTSIILPLKNQFILQTISSDQHSNNKVKQNIQTNQILPTLDLTQLKAFFTKVLSFTKYLQQLIIQINGKNIFQVNKTIQPLNTHKLINANHLLNENNDHQLLHFTSLQQTQQTFNILNGPSIDLIHFHVQANIRLDQQFQKQIEQIIKKSLPSTIQIQFLVPSNDILENDEWKSRKKGNVYVDMLKELIPLKYEEEGQINPTGQIFIGLATHQSTGIGMHLFTHLIPTIERENIDLQDPYIAIWNEQILTSIGIIVRFIYDQTILFLINNTQQSNQLINTLLSPFSFTPSTPNPNIGRLIVDGFFSCDRDLLVPVRRNPSDKHLSLIPSSEAYLSISKHIQSFLPLPLVPFEIGKNQFFKTLKQYNWIKDINQQIIQQQIHQIILSKDQFIGLLRWLCTNDVNDKDFKGNILSLIRYRDEILIELNQIKYYDQLNLPSIPLPSNVLPSSIVSHLSREDLQNRLFLSPITLEMLIQFYLSHSNEYLTNEKTSPMILSLISSHLNQLNNQFFNIIKEKLSNIKCIPTSAGMNIPNDSYLYSSSSSSIGLIQLNIPQLKKKEEQSDQYPVSMDFLKSIGCRTIYVAQLNHSKEEEEENCLPNHLFIEDLMEKRRNLSENDLKALRNSRCLYGTTLNSNSTNERKSRPNELHFPWIAQELQWEDLIILDWNEQLDQRSQQYSFLKDIGVKTFPDLHLLIQRINQEYQNQTKQKQHFQIPKSFRFFVEHFQSDYSKLWKNFSKTIPFLPSSLGECEDVILTTADVVFQEMNPFFPSLLVDVVRLLSSSMDPLVLGIRVRPNISMAFTFLLERRTQLLTEENLPKYFSYLNKLDGINKKFIQDISQVSFIPLKDQKRFAKPSEVFIRSQTDQTNQEEQEEISRGLIDFVDFGEEANAFLRTIGVLSYPSVEDLLLLLLDRQQSYLKGNEQILSSKLRFYTNCLKQISIGLRFNCQLNIEQLRSRLRNDRWCLAYSSLPNCSDKTFEIVRPCDVYLDDDHQSAQDLHPLCAPDEPELISLYQSFGSKWLSEHVQRTLIHQGNVFLTDRSKKLFQLINHRLDMLFVNNRGQFIDNFHEKRFQLLKNDFNVYECDSIQCQIHFQKKTIQLNSNECSSCSLELDKNKVILFLRKDLLTIDYIDISSELTRFVTNKSNETIIHSISDKLSSPLQTLKRRGIPVDRLLKTKAQQQAVKFVSTPIEEKEERTQSVENGGGFLQSVREMLNPSERKVDSRLTNSNEKVRSEIRNDRMEDFGLHQVNEENEMKEIMTKTRPYSKGEFVRDSSYREETNTSCEFVPSTNLIRYEYLFHGIAFYYDKSIQLNATIVQHVKEFSFLLSFIAQNIFHLSLQTIHVFKDIDSSRIAFNSNGSLFYNVRYFEQVFANSLKSSLEKGMCSSSSSPIIRKILHYYYMVTCHELCHNLYSNHDLNFLNCLERVSVQFMDEKDRVLDTFTF